MCVNQYYNTFARPGHWPRLNFIITNTHRQKILGYAFIVNFVRLYLVENDHFLLCINTFNLLLILVSELLNVVKQVFPNRDIMGIKMGD